MPEWATRYLLAPSLSDGLRVLRDQIAESMAFERVVVVATLNGRGQGVGLGVADEEVGRAAEWYARQSWDTGPSANGISGEEWLDGGVSTLCAPVAVGPLGEGGFDVVVVVDAVDGTPEVEAIEEHLQRAVPFLARRAETEALRAQVQSLESRQRRGRTALDTLPDPVFVVDAEGRTLLANRRAEELFETGQDDSPGRRHAMETNNLLFSAFRARTIIGQLEARHGEVLLVDPTDGSDLLFEVTVAPFPEIERGSDGFVFVLRDITDLKQAVHELEVQVGLSAATEHAARRESSRLNVIIENAGAPILVTDPQANVVLTNREAEELLAGGASDAGPSRSREVGKNDAKLAGFINEFMLQSALRREGQLVLIDPIRGVELPCLVVSTKILDAHREATAVVTVLRDLTQEVENQRLALELRSLNAELEERVRSATHELAERNAQLERQSSEVERASRMKTEFLATMSHELRTPINAMLGYNALLRDGLLGELRAEQHDALERMRGAAEHLLMLISDILDLSRVEAGQIQLTESEVDLADFLYELAESVRPMAGQKDLAFSLDLVEPLPPMWTDATRLRQILLNLLSNAVKFTLEGSVTLTARSVQGGRRIRFEVRDTGIGIDRSDLETIFDQFTQADQSVTRQHGGAGLGLTISRRLIEVMGGDIGVQSTLGGGSTFYVELSAEPPASGSDAGSDAGGVGDESRSEAETEGRGLG